MVNDNFRKLHRAVLRDRFYHTTRTGDGSKKTPSQPQPALPPPTLACELVPLTGPVAETTPCCSCAPQSFRSSFLRFSSLNAFICSGVPSAAAPLRQHVVLTQAQTQHKQNGKQLRPTPAPLHPKRLLQTCAVQCKNSHSVKHAAASCKRVASPCCTGQSDTSP